MPNWELNYDVKLRVNLSALALSVIEQDSVNFRTKNRTYFLNRVFVNAYRNADASIAQRLAQTEQEYAELLEAAQLSAPQKEAVLRRLLKKTREELLSKQPVYEKAHAPFHHKLSKQAEAVFTGAAVSREGAFYTPSQYFRAVIEEYCRKSALEREAIYFQESLELIRQAIAQQTQLEVCNFSGVRYLVHPYRLLEDPLGTAHYLACYGRTGGQGVSQKVPCSFRISNLKQIEKTGEKAFISAADRDKLEQLIQSQGVQFLVGRAKEIKVKLTPQGVRKLNRHSTLRPICTGRTQDGIFTFCCTETQAEYYFLKLGADAQILSPLRLRNKMKQMHQQAVSNYGE